MSTGLEFTVSDISDAIRVAFRDKDGPIAQAATAAVHQAGEALKTAGRNDIAQAGFGARWQNTWTVKYYPDSGVSVDAAAWVYHKIPYAGVFETGATITGKPMLWLPLSGTTKKVGRDRATPKRLAASGVKLFSIERPGQRPLLATSVNVSKSQAQVQNLSLSLARLRSGARRKTGVSKTIPLFVGVSSIRIRKRFHISTLADLQRGKLGSLYFQNLKT